MDGNQPAKPEIGPLRFTGIFAVDWVVDEEVVVVVVVKLEVSSVTCFIEQVSWRHARS